MHPRRKNLQVHSLEAEACLQLHCPASECGLLKLFGLSKVRVDLSDGSIRRCRSDGVVHRCGVDVRLVESVVDIGTKFKSRGAA